MLQDIFIAPDFDGHNFANLPATIRYWLTGQGMPGLAPDVLGPFTRQFDTVIVLLIDSFGWSFFEKYADEYPFLQHLIRNGQVSKITAQFPSTTAAHVTCINTGLSVGQSGIYEWQYYEPKLDAVILPLLFSYAGTKEREQLRATGIDARELYPPHTFYEELGAHGVRSFVLGHAEYADSTYTRLMTRGAQPRPYKTLAEGLTELVTLAAQASPPLYLFLYYDGIDTLCHEYGPDSLQTYVEMRAFLWAMERVFLERARGKLKNTLLVLTADHGHVRAFPKETIYVNLDPQLQKIVPWLRRDRQGRVLPPGGSPRDMFLYVRDEYLDEAQALLANGLRGRANVVLARDLLKQGYFGKLPVCADLYARLGNLVILSYPDECVWWYEEGRFEQKFYGHHGGLTRAEMEIPLCLLDLSA